jgi:hypothetical protein
MKMSRGGIHPHCNGKSAEPIEKKRVAGRPLRERVRKPLEAKELNGLEELKDDARAWFLRGLSGQTRVRIPEKYHACQLLYRYRSNELWKNIWKASRNGPGKVKSPTRKTGVWGTQIRLRALRPGHAPSCGLWKSYSSSSSSSLSSS